MKGPRTLSRLLNTDTLRRQSRKLRLCQSASVFRLPGRYSAERKFPDSDRIAKSPVLLVTSGHFWYPQFSGYKLLQSDCPFSDVCEHFSDSGQMCAGQKDLPSVPNHLCEGSFPLLSIDPESSVPLRPHPSLAWTRRC